MGKHIVKPEEIKTRAYKLLLYPDNGQHMRILHTLQNHPVYKRFYVGIWHTLRDEKTGQEIMQGHGKKHAHIILNVENPIWWQSLCNNLGADFRFCMPISVNIDNSGKFVKDGRGSVDRGYIYLIHLNAPDKEQYSTSDLWGAEEMIENAMRACDAFLMRNMPMSQCVGMALDWIHSQPAYISWSAFSDWILKTPYFKAQSSPLVRAVLDEHNKSALRDRARSKVASEQVAENEVLQKKVVNSECAIFNLNEFMDIDSLPDYRYFDDGGIMI